MGGCATKPKVFKGDDKAEVPAPATPTEEVPAAKVAAFVADGEKKVETDEVAKAKLDAVVDGNIDDDQSNKRSRSLSNLFKQKETEAATETDQSDNKTPSEPETAKQESSEPLKQQPVEDMKTEAVEAVSTINQETKEAEKPMELVSGFPETIESAQPMEAKPAPEAAATAAAEAVNVLETQSKETSTDETKDKTVVEN